MKKQIQVSLVILVCAICSFAIYLARQGAKSHEREGLDRPQSSTGLVSTAALSTTDPIAASSQEHHANGAARHSPPVGTAATATSTESIISDRTLTVDGISYEAVVLGEVTNNMVMVTHRSGSTPIPLQRLSPELQKHFGYDPEKDDYTYILLPEQQGAIRYFRKTRVRRLTPGPPGN